MRPDGTSTCPGRSPGTACFAACPISGELCRRVFPVPDLKAKIPLIPPARSNDRHTAFVRGIFSALTRRDHANLRSRAGLSIKRVWGGESLNCARLSRTNRRTAYCSCARRCENAKRHHSQKQGAMPEAWSHGRALRAMRSHRRALRERYRAPRLPPPRGPRANGIPM